MTEDMIFEGCCRSSVKSCGYCERLRPEITACTRRQHGIGRAQLALTDPYCEHDAFRDRHSHAIARHQEDLRHEARRDQDRALGHGTPVSQCSPITLAVRGGLLNRFDPQRLADQHGRSRGFDQQLGADGRGTGQPAGIDDQGRQFAARRGRGDSSRRGQALAAVPWAKECPVRGESPADDLLVPRDQGTGRLEVLSVGDGKKNAVHIKRGMPCGQEHADRPNRGESRNLPGSFGFICFIDEAGMEVGGLSHLGIWKIPVSSVQSKFALLRPEAALEGTCLFIELDVVIWGRIDRFFGFPDEFRVICRKQVGRGSARADHKGRLGFIKTMFDISFEHNVLLRLEDVDLIHSVATISFAQQGLGHNILKNAMLHAVLQIPSQIIKALELGLCRDYLIISI